MGRLDDMDLAQRLGRSEYDERLKAAQRRFVELRLRLGGQTNVGEVGPGVLVVVEGVDAAGKGGSIKRLVEPLDPRHFSVYSYAKPNSRELRHHFLWRFWSKVPGHGGLCVFDRSWYGRLLVERVEGFASIEQWMRAYNEIVEFERSLVLEGVILVKIWMHVSLDEQLRRFERRANDPLRSWKLGDEDWRNRQKWPQYRDAIEDMFTKTDHELAPWNLIPSEQKKFGRVTFIETVNRRLEEGLARWEAAGGR